MRIRIRLTLFYGIVFLVAGTLLIVVNYTLLDRSLPSNATNPATGQDLVARASKLADPQSHTDLTADQRRLMAQIATTPPGQAVKLANQLSLQIGKPVSLMLFSGLPGDVSSHTRSTMIRESLIGLAAAAIVAFALGWYGAGHALRPIQTIIATAQQLSDKNLDLRIGLNGPDDELKQLADTFDAMLARLDAAFQAQRRFVADASHELRTPLTIMRTELDVTLRRPDPERLTQMAHVLSDAVDRSEQLVASLLALATSEHGPDNMTHVDLADTARSAVQRAEPAARARSVDVRTATNEPAAVEGDPALLDRLVDNLLDNAIRHNQPSGTVDLSVSPDHGVVTLTVANTGPIVPDYALDTLFEPFHRMQRGIKAPGGFGLGLAIVRSATRAHHGEVTARANPGGGLTITVTLPAAPAHNHTSPLNARGLGRLDE